MAAAQVAGDAAREFDDFLAAGDLAESVGDDLAVFGGDDLGQFLLPSVEQFAEVEEDSGPLGQGRVAPGGERGGCCSDRRFHGGLRPQGHLAADDSGGRVRDIAEAGVGVRGDGPSVDPVGERCHEESFCVVGTSVESILCPLCRSRKCQNVRIFALVFTLCQWTLHGSRAGHR